MVRAVAPADLSRRGGGDALAELLPRGWRESVEAAEVTVAVSVVLSVSRDTGGSRPSP